jgi:hypothetical protein
LVVVVELGLRMMLPSGTEDIEYRGYRLMVRQYDPRYRVFICPPGTTRALHEMPHGKDRAAVIDQAKAIVDAALAGGGSR